MREGSTFQLGIGKSLLRFWPLQRFVKNGHSERVVSVSGRA